MPKLPDLIVMNPCGHAALVARISVCAVCTWHRNLGKLASSPHTTYGTSLLKSTYSADVRGRYSVRENKVLSKLTRSLSAGSWSDYKTSSTVRQQRKLPSHRPHAACETPDGDRARSAAISIAEPSLGRSINFTLNECVQRVANPSLKRVDTNRTWSL